VDSPGWIPDWQIGHTAAPAASKAAEVTGVASSFGSGDLQRGQRKAPAAAPDGNRTFTPQSQVRTDVDMRS
jgi:hypothetical protein